jgi:hypothetical protein
MSNIYQQLKLNLNESRANNLQLQFYEVYSFFTEATGVEKIVSPSPQNVWLFQIENAEKYNQSLDNFAADVR